MTSENIIPFPEQSVTVGGPVDDASVSLDIYGDALDPDEITQLLGLLPTHSHRRGDQRRPDGPPSRTGAWLHQVKVDVMPDAPEVALRCLLDRLPSDASLWARLVQQYDIRLNLCIGFTGWNKGFALSGPTLQRAAVLGVRMDFDLYASDNQPPEFDQWTTR